MPSGEFWADKRVLLTGHTGFKGSWVWAWLRRLGADVHGMALPPDTDPSLWSQLNPESGSHFGDIRDLRMVEMIMGEADPEIVLHLAAQPLVRRSYTEPLLTVATNILGTANVLDAARRAPSVRAVVSVTSDKCYSNAEKGVPFREDDPLGGDDPYSASKACAEIVTAAWRQSFLEVAGIAVATARAGNA